MAPARPLDKGLRIHGMNPKRRCAMAENDKEETGFLKGMIIGGVIGALAGVLFAPKAGKEIRSDLKEKGEKVFGKAEEIYNEAAAKAKTIVDEAKQKAEELKREADRQLAEARQRAKDILARRDKTGGAPDAGGESPGQS